MERAKPGPAGTGNASRNLASLVQHHPAQFPLVPSIFSNYFTFLLAIGLPLLEGRRACRGPLRKERAGVLCHCGITCLQAVFTRPRGICEGQSIVHIRIYVGSNHVKLGVIQHRAKRVRSQTPVMLCEIVFTPHED